MVDFSRLIVGGLLLAVACGKPTASSDASSVGGDATSSPNNGPGGPSDGPIATSDGHAIDAPLIDAPGRPGDAPRPNDASVADATLADAVVMPGMPSLGAHAMSFYHLGAVDPTTRTITTPAMSTRSSGSTIVVSVGRGDNTLFALPTDSRLNAPYQLQGQMHPYLPAFPESGTALYAFPSANGGSGFTVSTTTGQNSRGQTDEITLAVVEVAGGTRVQDFQWNELTSPPLTSRSVTTTGPATLIAFWWGDGFPDTTPQTAIPDSGFVVVDTNVQELHSFVQCAVAVKSVTTAGTYNVTWTATPTQGAQLWLVAVQ